MPEPIEVETTTTVPSGTPIKFGFGQIGKDTPKFISNIKRALNFFIGGAVIFMPTMALNFHTTVDNLSFIFGMTILFVNTVGIMFGVPPDTVEIKK